MLSKLFIAFVVSMPAWATSYFTIRTGNWNNNTAGQTPWATGSCASPVQSLNIPGNGDTIKICNGHTLTSPYGYTATFGTSGASATVDLSCNTASGTGVLVINGGFVYRGGWQPCSAWVIGPSAHITHDSSLSTSPSPSATNYLVQFPSGCTTCSLTSNGMLANGVTWDIAAGSGNAGYIGVVNAGTPGRMTATYTDWSDIGTSVIMAMQMSLNTAGDTFSLHDSTCTRCSGIRVWKVADGTNLSIQRFVHADNIAGPSATNRAIALGEASTLGAKTSGTREIIDSFMSGIGAFYTTCSAPGVDPGIVFRRNILYATGTAAAVTAVNCAYSGTNWENNLIWTNPVSSSGAINTLPSGTITRTYALASSSGSCSAKNLHFGSPNSASGTIDTWIGEPDCNTATGAINGKFIDDGVSTTGPFTRRITNTITLPSTAGVGGSAGTGTVGPPLILYDHGAAAGCDNATKWCPVMTVDHNTLYGTDGTESGFYVKEGPDTQVPLVAGVRDNIQWLPSSGPMGKLTYLGSVADGTYQSVGCNWFWNDNGLGAGYQTAGGNAEYANPPTPGGAVGTCPGDQNGDPQFVDPTRNFIKWCQLQNPADVTWADCFEHFKTINRPINYNPSNLIEYVRDGFAPRNQAIANADSVGGYLGAVPPKPKPALMFTDIISGPKTGGENNKGVYVCVRGENFGPSRGTSTITVGGGLVDNYPVWEDLSWASDGPARSKACFQLGPNAATGNIVMTVNGQASNPLPFTVRAAGTSPDGIWCVAPVGDPLYSGNDANSGHFPSCKATWKAVKTAGFAAGDVAYILGSVMNARETGTAGAYAYYILPAISGASANMPVAFLGYPGRTVEFGDNDADTVIVTSGTTTAAGNYWVLGNFNLRCSMHGYACITTSILNTPKTIASMTTGHRWVNIKVQAPKASMAQAGAITPFDMHDSKFLGLEVTNTGCGFGRTGGPDDGAAASDQDEQYRCPELTMTSTLSSTGTTVSAATGNLLGLAVGSHICVPDCINPANERTITALPDGTSFIINEAYSPDLVSAAFTHVPHMASNFLHSTYPGGMEWNNEIGWWHIHNNSTYKGISQNPNYTGTLIASATTTKSGPDGAALITLSTPCPSLTHIVTCANGDPVDLISMTDTTLNGQWYLKAIDTTHFYVYSDAALTTPVAGSTSCSSGACGTAEHGIIVGWGFDIHDNRFAHQNGIAIQFGGLAPGRGPVKFYNNVFVSNGQGPTYNGWNGGIAGTVLSIGPTNTHGIWSGTYQIYNNTFYDSSRYLAEDLPSTYTHYTGAVATYMDGVVYDIRNNIFYNLDPSIPYGSWSATGGPVTGSTSNLFYGGSHTTTLSGMTTTPTILTDTQISCPAPCDLFENSAEGNLELASLSVPAAFGGSNVTATVARDFLGLLRPTSPSIGSYELFRVLFQHTKFIGRTIVREVVVR